MKLSKPLLVPSGCELSSRLGLRSEDREEEDLLPSLLSEERAEVLPPASRPDEGRELDLSPRPLVNPPMRGRGLLGRESLASKSLPAEGAAATPW